MTRMQLLYLIVPLAPLVGAVVAGLFGQVIGRRGAHWVTIAGMVVSTLAAGTVFLDVLRGNFYDGPVYTWLASGNVRFEIGFLIDRLSATMMLTVAFVSLMVHVYTIGYMADDPGYQRFFSYISLFTFSRLMLVMANNFLQLFFGWEAVGLMSYLLIGFWFKRESAIFANLKAFIVNRVGDFGFILGIAAVLYYTGSLDYIEVFAAAKGVAPGRLRETERRTFSPAINTDVSLARGPHQWSVGGAVAWIERSFGPEEERRHERADEMNAVRTGVVRWLPPGEGMDLRTGEALERPRACPTGQHISAAGSLRDGRAIPGRARVEPDRSRGPGEDRIELQRQGAIDPEGGQCGSRAGREVDAPVLLGRAVASIRGSSCPKRSRTIKQTRNGSVETRDFVAVVGGLIGGAPSHDDVNPGQIVGTGQFMVLVDISDPLNPTRYGSTLLSLNALAVASYLNHGTTAQQILRHVRGTARRTPNRAEAREILSRRGTVAAALKGGM